MSAIKLPLNVTSITVSGTVHTPSGARNTIVPVTDALATALNHWHSRPRLRKTAANGDTTILLPGIISSITIDGIVYIPNAAAEIVVPAVAATAFLQEFKYLP